VVSDDLAFDVANGAARHMRALPFHECCVIAVWHEADLMTVGLFRNRQAKRARMIPDRGFVHRAYREHRVRKLRLIQREEEVGLILRRVHAAQQLVAPGLGVEIDARVVAGGDKLGVESRGTLSERRELQVAVAMNAGNGRPAACVLVHEIRDHLIGELALEVDDVVRDTDAGRDTPRVVQVVDGTAGAEPRRLTS
jgi:hypothetical protein